MKKFVCILCALLMLVSVLSGCGSKTNTSDTPSNEPASNQTDRFM